MEWSGAGRAVIRGAERVRDHSAAPGSNALSVAPSSLVGRRFELKELEDADSCSTVVELNEDGTITLGGTTGPKWLEASGNWFEGKDFDGKRSIELKLT